MNETPEKFNLDDVIEWLQKNDYRVTRPLKVRNAYSDAAPVSTVLKAAILDTETTGLSPVSDKIIELGIVFVDYCPETGLVYRVLEIFDELEDPGMPIPPESTRIHGSLTRWFAAKR